MESNHEERDAEICRLYKNGLTLRALGEQFGLTHERVRQILRKAGAHEAYRKKAARRVRQAFLGVNISEGDKVALCQEAERRGISMSALTAELIKDMLAQREVGA